MKRRNDAHQDPEQTRELAAVEAALAGETVEPDLAELAELALVLRAERPRPRPEFAAELDAREREGFASARASTEVPESETAEVHPSGRGARILRRVRGFWPPHVPRRALPLAFGSAASMLIVATVIVSSGVLRSNGSGGSVTAPAGGVEADQPAALQSKEAPGSVGAVGRGTEAPREMVAPSPELPPAGGIAPGRRNREVESGASLTLGTATDKVEETADGVIRVTDRYRGFVLSSSISGGDDGRAGATLDLRIPARRLQAALRDLSQLAHVRSRTQSSQDVTAAVVSAKSRVNQLRAERRGLLKRLAGAETSKETASIRARLRVVNRQIASARSSLRGLRDRVRFAAVSVVVEADGAAKGDGTWTPADALQDALSILGVSLAIALVSVAVLIPVSLLLLLGWLGYRRNLRGHREQALDGEARD